MKKISLLALILVFIGAVSQAEQKIEADKSVEKQGSSSSLFKPETAPKMTARTADGDCPRIGYKKSEALSSLNTHQRLLIQIAHLNLNEYRSIPVWSGA